MHFLKMHENIPKIAVMMLVTCDLVCALGASAINSQKSDIKPYESMITEYFKDHEVTEKQARESLRLMKEDEFKPPAHCRPCTKEQKQYCNSEFLLKDHCCCNQSHKKEQLYFIPHECYINSDIRCTPSLGGSCLTVMHIRSCCCDAQLKKHWHSVLAKGHMIHSTRCNWILVTIVLLISSFFS